MATSDINSPFAMLVGVVMSTVDFTETGLMKVDIEGEGLVDVQYVTPFNSNQQAGGFWAIPTEGTEVLVCRPSNRKAKWYYMGSVVAPNIADISKWAGDDLAYSESLEDINLSTKRTAIPPSPVQYQAGPPQTDTYKARFKPMKYNFLSPMGQGLTISDAYDSSGVGSEAFYNKKVELKSTDGQRLEINDSPHVSNIVVSNKDGDAFHKISSLGVPPAQAAASQQFHSRLNETHYVQNGLFQVWVQDGKNLQLVNTSTGSQRDASFGANNVLSSTDFGTWGKIILKTDNNDIEIFADDGALSPLDQLPSIKLTTKGSDSVIQLDSAGRVSIIAASGINLTTDVGDINLSATTGNIKLTAGQNIELN